MKTNFSSFCWIFSFKINIKIYYIEYYILEILYILIILYILNINYIVYKEILCKWENILSYSQSL